MNAQCVCEFFLYKNGGGEDILNILICNNYMLFLRSKFSTVYCIFAFVSFNAYVIIGVDDWLVGSAGSIINNSILIMMLQTNTVRRMMLSTSRKGSQRWRFMSTTMKSSGLEGPEEEKLIHPSLKNFVNRTAIAMQMPDMRRKYAISDAPLIPSYFLGKLQLVWFWF